jgi:hypothetical protein
MKMNFWRWAHAHPFALVIIIFFIAVLIEQVITVAACR